MRGADTIAALATPFGAGAVAMVRISGPQALEVAGRIFRGRRAVGELPAGRVVQGRIERDGVVADEVLLTVFRSPRSYTGEDVVEISGHGGVVVAQAVLRLVLEAGARPAEPGEFTRRAFLNGKMDLTQAEAVMDLIAARGEASARAAAGQLEGRLGRVIERLREDALTALAHLEAFIDFPEEGIDPDSGQALLGRIDGLHAAVNRLLATADEGRMLREGVRLVIHGEPNVGKSSLLNLLLGYDRAMVSEIPGTTRDTIEENLTLRGIPFRVIDTAGLRESADPLELEGMRRTRHRLEQADVAVRVLAAPEIEGVGAAMGPREIVVLNKIDLWRGGEVPAAMVPVCCLDGRGLEELVGAIIGATDLAAAGRMEEVVAVNVRHQHCLKTARDYLEDARRSLERGDAPELTALELRSALAAIGEITGAVDTEEVLGKIFGSFCIGK
jgi:tRNA modification GTPase